jgi:hypothetical protein
MTTFSTKADILRALADGKTVVQADGVRYRLGYSIEVCPKNSSAWRCDSISLGAPPSFYSLHVEPNPHPNGSYFWAYEETQRGRAVTRKGANWCFTRGAFDKLDAGLIHSDFIATDWCHAT